ncbi:MAG: hypothetical protein LBC79_08200, partial [Deltaproteobacteria bacterium]|nr:hypothetical protein [Deltaproteobacteria bacterium]
EFYAGVLLFEVYKAGARLPVMLSLCLGLLALAAFRYFAEDGLSQARFLCWGIPALALVSSFLFFEKEMGGGGYNIPKFLIFFGDASYTLYLSHYVTLPGIGKISAWTGLHKALPPDAQILLYTAACIVLGCVLYMTTEKPLLNRLKARRAAKKSPCPAVRSFSGGGPESSAS